MKKISNISVTTKRGRLPPEMDYAHYTFSRQEIVMYLMIGALFNAMISWLFYDSIIAWFLMLPLFVLSLTETGI